jgi:hypothetical protein
MTSERLSGFLKYSPKPLGKGVYPGGPLGIVNVDSRTSKVVVWRRCAGTAGEDGSEVRETRDSLAHKRRSIDRSDRRCLGLSLSSSEDLADTIHLRQVMR